MAFQQPQRSQATKNNYTSSPLPIQTQLPNPQELTRQQSREWIIFAPDSPAVTDNHTISTARTPRTAGRSRLSELGSLATDAASNQENNEEEEEDDLETEDMDSLDDGLHAFHEPISRVTTRHVERSGDTLLPAHDGLGMFTTSSIDVQKQLWQHERYNPRRRRRSLRRSSFQQRFGALEEEISQDVEEEKLERIEKWRLDQSRAILEEIERETRRKRRRENLTASTSQADVLEPPWQMSSTLRKEDSSSPSTSNETESFWTRLTRKVICDLMGFDDATLSLIFGEALVEDEDAPLSPSEMIEEAERTIPDDAQLTNLGDAWQERLLARIAKELGLLVHKLTANPGAFSAYSTAKEPPLYPGLISPVTPLHTSAPASKALPIPTTTMSSTGLQFSPTLPHQDHTQFSVISGDPSLWGIEEEGADPTSSSDPEAVLQQNEREYWEQDLDVRVFFRYIRGRLSSSRHFSRRQSQPDLPGRSTNAAINETRNEAESLRRAALIRRHHPLVSKNFAAAASSSWEQGENVQRLSRGRPTTVILPVLGRRFGGRDESVTSCATQSTKRSKTGRSGSSRNYWDVGTGSLGSGGWNAGWGEV